jgi:hypothetical protein
MGGREPAVPGRLLVSSEEQSEWPAGAWDASVSDAFFVSSIVRNPAKADCFHDD